jgi:hypothetical protein
MAEVLVRFTERIRNGSGPSYLAQACGTVGPDGLWDGWIEFVEDNGPAIRSPRETQQPNRDALMYWAEGLSATYLEGALRRSLDMLTPLAERSSTADASIFGSPATRGSHRSHDGLGTSAIDSAEKNASGSP